MLMLKLKDPELYLLKMPTEYPQSNSSALSRREGLALRKCLMAIFRSQASGKKFSANSGVIK